MTMTKTAAEFIMGVWTAPEVPLLVEYPLELMEGLRALLCDELQQLSRAGTETAGVLFGASRGKTIRVLAWRPTSRGLAEEQSERLSLNDRAEMVRVLSAAASDPSLRGFEPLGWFVSHPESIKGLTAADVELFNNFFPNSWQVTLLLRRAASGTVRAGFFVRETDGFLKSDASYRELLIQPLRGMPGAPVPSPLAPSGPPLGRASWTQADVRPDTAAGKDFPPTAAAAAAQARPARNLEEPSAATAPFAERAPRKPPAMQMPQPLAEASAQLEREPRNERRDPFAVYSAGTLGTTEWALSRHTLPLDLPRAPAQKSQPAGPPAPDLRAPVAKPQPTEAPAAVQQPVKPMASAATASPSVEQTAAASEKTPTPPRPVSQPLNAFPAERRPPNVAPLSIGVRTAETPRFAVQQHSFGGARWLWIFPILLTVAVLVALFLQKSGADPSQPFSLRVGSVGETVEITWNRNSIPIRDGQRALIEIQDGVTAKQISLTAGQLRAASTIYFRETPDVAVQMTVYGAGKREYREFARLVVQPSPAASAQTEKEPESTGQLNAEHDSLTAQVRQLREQARKEAARADQAESLVRILENRLKIDGERGAPQAEKK